MPDLPDVRLRTNELELRAVPAQGADIVSLTERSGDTELLYRTPWAGTAPRRPGWGADSHSWWMSRYPGGWQVLCPNAGPERTAAGTVWGFHGEASVVPWTVVEHEEAGRLCAGRPVPAGPAGRVELAPARPDLLAVPRMTPAR